MPLPKGTKYRYIKGTKIRLAFNKAGKVIERKDMKTGKTETMMTKKTMPKKPMMAKKKMMMSKKMLAFKKNNRLTKNKS